MWAPGHPFSNSLHWSSVLHPVQGVRSFSTKDNTYLEVPTVLLSLYLTSLWITGHDEGTSLTFAASPLNLLRSSCSPQRAKSNSYTVQAQILGQYPSLGGVVQVDRAGFITKVSWTTTYLSSHKRMCLPSLCRAQHTATAHQEHN